MATLKKSYDLAIGDYIDKQCQANFMKYVNSQPRDPIRQLFSSLKEENFIYMGFKHMERADCSDEDRNRLLPFLHDKYKFLKPTSFDFRNLVFSDSLAAEDFFTMCAKTPSDAEKYGWHVMTIKHAVVCGYVHLYINEAHRRAYAKNKDPSFSINKSLPFDINKPDTKAGKFAKIMRALLDVYPIFTDPVLRAILSRNSLAHHSILKKLGNTAVQHLPAVVDLFRYVLMEHEDFTSAYDGIYATVKECP